MHTHTFIHGTSSKRAENIVAVGLLARSYVAPATSAGRREAFLRAKNAAWRDGSEPVLLTFELADDETEAEPLGSIALALLGGRDPGYRRTVARVPGDWITVSEFTENPLKRAA